MTLPGYLTPRQVKDITSAQALRLKTRLLLESYDKLMEDHFLTREQRLERFYLVLAQRLLRAKFYSFPAYTNEQLAYLVGCPTGAYLGMIMNRSKRPSDALAHLIHASLQKLEQQEGMPPIYQPEFPSED